MRAEAAYGRPTRQRALHAVLAATVLIPLATIGFAAWFAWKSVWTEAEANVSRSADAVAQYALRVLDGYRLSAERVNDALRGLSDADIRAREAEVHAALRALVPRLPLVQTAVVLAEDGAILTAANVFPIPAGASSADREWVVALRDPAAPEPHVSRVLTGRIDDNLFFGVSTRRTGTGNGVPAGAVEGLINISVNPNTVAAGFTDLLPDADDVVSLIRADGHILARRPGFQAPPPRIGAATGFARAVASGAERTVYRAPAAVSGQDMLFAVRKVSGYPIHASVGRSVAAIRARWAGVVALQLVWGAPATLALFGTALFALFRTRAAQRAEQAAAEQVMLRYAAEAREAAEARFRGVFESRAVGFAILDLARGEAIAANDRLLEMSGRSRDRAGPGGDWRWGASSAPEDAARDAAALAEARERGWFAPYERSYVRADGTRLPVRVASAPLPREPGHAVVIVQDITEQREAEVKRDLLMQEVNHRAKNALATARAALRLTRAETMEGFVQRVDGRIGALATAMEVLARTGWRGADLEQVIRGELVPFVEAGVADAVHRVELAGPPVLLAGGAVQAVSMALHEMATNATKHGALSVPGGALHVGWEVSGTPARLRITWTERDGPRIERPPGTAGFGSRVVQATMERQLGGKVGCEWQPDGLVCVIDLPAARAVAATEAVEAVA